MADDIGFQEDVGFNSDNAQQGSSIPGKDETDALQGTVKTMFGQLPYPASNPIMNPGNVKGMIDMAAGIPGEGAAINALKNPKVLEYGKEIAQPIINAGENALNYLRPGKSVNELMTNLGGGAKTAQENSANIAKRVELAYNSNKADALASKQNVLSQVGNKDMFEIPEEKLPEGNLDQIAEMFNGKGEHVSKDQASDLSDALSDYRKTGNFNNFYEKAHDIFPSEEGISDSDMDKLTDMLSLPEKGNSQYLNTANNYKYTSKALQDLHDEFEENPTFKNADELQSQLGTEIGRLSYKAEKKDLDTNGYNELQSLKSLRDSLNADQKVFLQGKDAKLDNEYDAFKQKWRENVVPYHSNDTLRKMSQGQTTGHSINDVSGTFKNDEPNALKIAQDIGLSGQNAILFNELQRVQPGDTKGFVNALNEARRIGGYQSYVTPQIQAQGKQIGNQLLARNALNIGGATAGGLVAGGVFGHPLSGAVAGLTAKPLLNRLLSKLDSVPK